MQRGSFLRFLTRAALPYSYCTAPGKPCFAVDVSCPPLVWEKGLERAVLSAHRAHAVEYSAVMSHVRPASWQHWADALKASKSTFKDKSVTHTSRTLFIAQVPHSVSVADLENVFKPLDGFIAARRVRGMGFIDFDTKQQATNAIGRMQGYKFPGDEKGLLISYDKDDEEDRGGTSKRQAEELRRRRQELEDSYTKLYCYACSHFALKLKVSVPLLPVRKTDGTRVASEKQLVSLDMAKGAAKAIKREKGIEKQYWLNCMQCDSVLAYRSTPFGKPAKFIYVHEGALRDDRNLCGTVARPPIGLLAAEVAGAVPAQAEEAAAAATAAAAAGTPISSETPATAEGSANGGGEAVAAARRCDESDYERERAEFAAKRQKTAGGGTDKQMRPGDWVCNARVAGGSKPCDAHNYASRRRCFACDAPREASVVGGNPNTAVANSVAEKFLSAANAAALHE